MRANQDFSIMLSEALGRLNEDGTVYIAVKDCDGFRTKYIELPNVSTSDLLDALLYCYDIKFMGE